MDSHNTGCMVLDVTRVANSTINNGKESTRVVIIHLLVVFSVRVGYSKQQHHWTLFGGWVECGSLKAEQLALALWHNSSMIR